MQSLTAKAITHSDSVLWMTSDLLEEDIDQKMKCMTSAFWSPAGNFLLPAIIVSQTSSTRKHKTNIAFVRWGVL